MPWVWFDTGENYGCSGPAAPWNPGTALARIRPHPGDGGKIAIQYVLLYSRDCGDFFASGHDGDVEPFALTLAPNADCPDGYGVYAAQTVAHEGTVADSRETQYLGLSCTWGRLGGGTGVLFSSENKHGNYLSTARCDRGGFWGSDHCSYGFQVPYNVLNVGERTRRRINALGAYQFPNEYVWFGTAFCGSRGACGGHAGSILSKLNTDGLLAPAY
ncbi:hypothetical protein E7T06_08360 [Deinococcus sp. Arct2-2]|uniref:hypothetical protein n=1 Tax=Deinococcus sp. Arct2-2 TaxID=2568653 RepID=UPI0010A2EE6E|nr:hypothetical protein [Deinococcus sp. Arct2-2]THF70188.1 hypothetical protein E7T06_08360 [Deinococcus sp. Arct2-2]